MWFHFARAIRKPLESRMAAPSAVDYAGLKSWIAQQESYEVAYSRPAPLTSAQQQAIAVLLTPVEHQAVAVLQAPAEYQAVAVLRAPVSPEPDIGNTDWVSALHRHRDARPRGATIKVTFLESGSVDRWTCYVTYEEAPGSAPTTYPVGETPVFKRKKEAKQFAAKECVMSLIVNKRMSGDRLNVTFPNFKVSSTPTSSPQEKRLKVTHGTGIDTASNLSTRFSSSAGAAMELTAPPSRRTANRRTKVPVGATVDFLDEAIAATRRVIAVCDDLKIPHPKYELDPQPMDEQDGPVVPNARTMWDGYADMGTFGLWLPDNVGHVTGILGKNCAKEAIAESLLEWLLVYKKNIDAQLNKEVGP